MPWTVDVWARTYEQARPSAMLSRMKRRGMGISFSSLLDSVLDESV
ncbi:MAG TPA: hypothetical protein VMM57_00160 [Bacteroidota bacterium]|nr:hypothetical protein [Bacteroidota bacterium]